MIDLRLLYKKAIFTFILLSLSKVLFAQIDKESYNFEESKVGEYQLPKLLETESGLKVSSTNDWEKLRRPEILSLFEEYVYGRVPKDFNSLHFLIKNEDSQAMNGRAHLKEVEIKVIRNGETLLLNLVLFIPNKNKKPVPVFLLINNRSERNTSVARDTLSGFWPAEEIIEAGYAIASFQVNDAAPDDKIKYKDGVLRLYPSLLSKDNGMKAIGSWAWAASRVMDYFETDDQIDHKRVALVGHSRGGKTALWAAASDKRFAMCISNNSGNTGAALSRRNFGETVLRINTNFPHWFNNNYREFNSKEDLLPIDQHMLIALIAPRPIYIATASQDKWSDPLGMFLAAKEAEKVYQLYRLNSNLPEKHPVINSPIYKSALGYHMREGKHDLMKYDWEQFIKFAYFHFM